MRTFADTCVGAGARGTLCAPLRACGGAARVAAGAHEDCSAAAQEAGAANCTGLHAPNSRYGAEADAAADEKASNVGGSGYLAAAAAIES